MATDKKVMFFLASAFLLGFFTGNYAHTLNSPTTFEECAFEAGVAQARTKLAANIIADMCWNKFNKNQ